MDFKAFNIFHVFGTRVNLPSCGVLCISAVVNSVSDSNSPTFLHSVINVTLINTNNRR